MEATPEVKSAHPRGFPSKTGPLLRSLLIWVVLFAVTLTAYNASFHITSGIVVKYLQVIPSAWIIEQTLPDTRIRYSATTIHSPGIEVHLLRGCDGMEAWLLLICALLAFPMPWKHRAIGIVYGTALIFISNIIRISSLYHVVLRRPEWFDMAHGIVWQSVMVLLASGFVLFWLEPERMAQNRRPTTS
ncbi:MAG TPA: archaeosortase/exosortase family protein [Kiritimatiellia bacterium]|nr:archaeosortase/exosortase family protein [Kiritimatiellia bacterium]